MDNITKQILELLDSNNLEVQKIAYILLNITKQQNNNDGVINMTQNKKWSLLNGRNIEIEEENKLNNMTEIVW
mgnify:CR=1 FL=1